MFGVPQRCVGEQRPDRSQAGITGAWAVVSVGFEVIEERRYRVGVEVGAIQPRWWPAGSAVHEFQGADDTCRGRRRWCVRSAWCWVASRSVKNDCRRRRCP